MEHLPDNIKDTIKREKIFYRDFKQINSQSIGEVFLKSLKRYNFSSENRNYSGILNEELQLSNVKKDILSHTIVGSRKWVQYTEFQNNFRVDQLGMAHLSIKIRIPLLQKRNIGIV